MQERVPLFMLLIANAAIYDAAARGFFRGDLLLEGGRIAEVSRGISARREKLPDDAVLDVGGRTVLPGLVDIHTHGRAGGDFGSADGAMLEQMLASYLASGVTTVLPTLASAEPTALREAIRRIGEAAAQESDPSLAGRRAHIAGVHLEGRYLNPSKRGAHAPELLAPLDADELEGFLRTMSGVRHVTAALELDADGSFLRRALSCGATVGLGHSMATYEQAMRAFADGATAVTHLYNALPPLHHRAGGAVCAALLSPDISCELICDGFHIAPEMVRLAATLKRERLVLITDSMEATGCPDGEYRIAGMPVTVKDGKARTHDGAIAGSTLSLLDGVRNYAAFAGVSFGTAVYAATMAPAIEVGLAHEIGSLEPGKRADLLILNADGTPAQVMCGGVFCGSANRGAV